MANLNKLTTANHVEIIGCVKDSKLTGLKLERFNSDTAEVELIMKI